MPAAGAVPAHAPKEPVRVCEECALKALAKEKETPHFIITEQTLLDLLKRGLS